MIDRYKYGIIAVFVVYIGIFMYLQMETYKQYFPIQPFFDDPSLILPEEEVEIKPENIEMPEGFVPGEVKNMSRDVNDSRKRSDDKYFQNKSAKQVEQETRDLERKYFEETGGEAKRRAIQQEMEQRKKDRSNTSTSNNTQSTSQQGGNTAYSGNVMVDWSLKSRTPHQNDNWWVRNPGYTCGYGSSGKVTVTIQVNQNGDVIAAEAVGSSGANQCMIDQAKKYAKMSRFNFSSSAPKLQEGKIVYTFISQ
jgi:outer membrane biosynthesis protein TonB